jgi:predicted DsbA family dithiol-disulfide isomerase
VIRKVEQFQQCLDSGKHAAEIRKDLEEGRKAGVRGTPMFFLGYTDPNESKFKTVTAVKGAQPYSRFKKAIDDLPPSQKK